MSMDPLCTIFMYVHEDDAVVKWKYKTDTSSAQQAPSFHGLLNCTDKICIFTCQRVCTQSADRERIKN